MTVGVFWDAVEEVSVLMNGDVEKGKKKLKKEKKKQHFLPLGSLSSCFWGPRVKKIWRSGALGAWRLTHTDGVHKWEKEKAHRR